MFYSFSDIVSCLGQTKSTADIINAKESIENVFKDLKAVRMHLQCINDKNINETVYELNEEEAAKLQVSLAYTLTSLYYIYIHSCGKSAGNNNDIVDEINRVKSYVAKLNSLGDQTKKRKIGINQAAATRIVKHHTSL